MAKDKERSVNPAMAAHKASKKAEIKKSKNAATAQRNEKLARQNPERLQKQVDDLKAKREADGGELKPREREQLHQLENQLRAVTKAREQLGIKDDGNGERGRRDRDGGVLGKRRRDSEDDDDVDKSDTTDDDARHIPMPRDTPPPIPPSRRRRRQMEEEAKRRKERDEQAKAQPYQASYSSGPQLRDLRKEAVNKFMPAAVAARLKQQQQQQASTTRSPTAPMAAEASQDDRGEEDEDDEALLRQMEEEERKDVNESLLRDARAAAEHVVDEADKEAQYEMMAEEVEGNNTHHLGAQAVEKKLRHVELEEVDDDGT